ncbi:MAG: hypothetical protein C0440_05415 [Candidatus Pelagibacter sp.]|nr:hypothetical protein [Candidatus Pelagibacter sp.]
MRFIFILLLFFGFASFLCNEKPLLIIHNHDLFCPVLFSYENKDFQFQDNTDLDYHDIRFQQYLKDKGGFILFPPVTYSAATIDVYANESFPILPSKNHWLGTDDYGRDIFAMIMYGSRNGMIVGFIVAILCSFLAIVFATIQGYFGGKADLFMQRICEMIACIPLVYTLILFSSLSKASYVSYILVMVIFGWVSLSSVLRIEVLKLKTLDFCLSAHISGLSSFAIIRKHIIPNLFSVVKSYYPFLFGGVFSTLTAVDYLGYKIINDSISLGDVTNYAQKNLDQWWVISSVVFIYILILVPLTVELQKNKKYNIMRLGTTL